MLFGEQFISKTMRRKYNTNSKIQNLEQLKPEQRRVFEVLKRHFPCWEGQCVDSITDEILLTGASCFIETPVTMDLLPSGNCWNWRQSNAKVSVKLDISTFATITKLNTTKVNSSSPKPPTYKFWIVQIGRPYQQHLWFLHCEKGLDILPSVVPDNIPVHSDFCDESTLQSLALPECPSWDALVSLLDF